MDRGDKAKLHQRRQDRDHEDIDHRPAADEFDHLEDLQPGMGLFGRGEATKTIAAMS